MIWQRDAIDDRAGGEPTPRQARAAAREPGTLAFLRLPSVWLCFSFFFFSTCALSGDPEFCRPGAAEDVRLALVDHRLRRHRLHGCAARSACSLGGFLAARAERLERMIGVCLRGGGAAAGAGRQRWSAGPAGAAWRRWPGFGAGLAGPSRDMLIKRAAPPGATGRVYGTVYSGLDLGFAMAAPVFGALLDRGGPAACSTAPRWRWRWASLRRRWSACGWR